MKCEEVISTLWFLKMKNECCLPCFFFFRKPFTWAWEDCNIGKHCALSAGFLFVSHSVITTPVFEPVPNKMLLMFSHFSIRHWNSCKMCIFILYGFETLDDDCSYKIKTYLEFSIFFYIALWCKSDECESDGGVKKYANICKRMLYKKRLYFIFPYTVKISF